MTETFTNAVVDSGASSCGQPPGASSLPGSPLSTFLLLFYSDLDNLWFANFFPVKKKYLPKWWYHGASHLHSSWFLI